MNVDNQKVCVSNLSQSHIFQSIKAFVVSMIVLSLLIFTFRGSSKVNAYLNNSLPEASLNIEYKQEINLDNAIESIRNQLPYRDINKISIANISTKIDFGTGVQTFSLANNDNQKSSDFITLFKKSTVVFAKNLETFKESAVQSKEYKAKNQIRPLVDKYSLESIKQVLYSLENSSQSISTITISGDLNNLTDIESSIKNKVKNTILIDNNTIKESFARIQQKLENSHYQEDKKNIIEEGVEQVLSKELEKEMEYSPNLTSLSRQEIQKIDKLLVKDIYGNKYIDSDIIKEKLGLSNQQVAEVLDALNKFNQLPEDIKDGTYQLVENIDYAESKQKTTELGASGFDFNNFIGSVTVNASTYSAPGSIKVYQEWWGYGVYLPASIIEELEYHVGNFGFGGLFGSLVASISARCGKYIVICNAVLGGMYLYFWAFTSYNRYNCEERGATIWKSSLISSSPAWFSC